MKWSQKFTDSLELPCVFTKTTQNDATIVSSKTIPTSITKKNLIPDNVGKIYCEAHEKMEIKTQLHNSISKKILHKHKIASISWSGSRRWKQRNWVDIYQRPNDKSSRRTNRRMHHTTTSRQGNTDYSHSWLCWRQAPLSKQLQRSISLKLNRYTWAVNRNLGWTPYICRRPTRDG